MKLFALISCVGAAASTALAGGSNGSGVIVLHPSQEGALSMTGKAAIRVPARAVYVNSSHNSAIRTVGTAVLDTPTLYSVGGWSFGGRSGCTGTTTRTSVPCDDPCAGLAIPSTSGMAAAAALSLSGGNVTLSPGYYAGGIQITGNTNLTLNPGVYHIGGNFRLTSGNIQGDGVTIIMHQGAMDIAGSSGLQLSPPADGPTSGFVIVQPASNNQELKLAGGSEVLISGTIYTPGAQLTLVGNSTLEGQGPQMGDLVVTRTLGLNGTSVIKIGTPLAAAVLPPLPPLFD
jgi:hypothetical protein